MDLLQLQRDVDSVRLQSKGRPIVDRLLELGWSESKLVELMPRVTGTRLLTNARQVAFDRGHPMLMELSSIGAWPILDGDTRHEMVALADPWDVDVFQRIQALVGGSVELVAASEALLQYLARMHRDEVSDATSTSVVDFIDTALRDAYTGGASDVHFEVSRSELVVKFRHDGVLLQHSSIQGRDRAAEVISRIKVLAHLDITEQRVPQDGRFRFAVASGAIDLRVSIMPSVFGEDAVLRLLDKAQLRARDSWVTLKVLGFDKASEEALRELGELPHGMTLITGPTGSGKTTTVYALLSEINTGREKIVTIEDPVEYELPGVLQIPVNERKGLTFARGLRSILRHDPDRILVGEIRDAETAEIAVQSALTGHQVFTTVHANSVLDVTGRFRHFGLDMFSFMSALNGVVVQRLVRILCPVCATQREATTKERQWLEHSNIAAEGVPRAVGCEQCHRSGYQGRIVIAEVHQVDDSMRDLVTTNAPVSRVREHIYQTGVPMLGVCGARLVALGRTTPEEVKRVVGW